MMLLSIASCDVDEVVHEKNTTWKEPSNRMVDVVLVCSEGEDMKSVAELLPDFVKRLDKALKKNEKSPQFGLVGFSGKAPVHRPGHAHTIKGRFFSKAEDVTKEVIEHMEYAAARLEFLI